MSLDGLNVKPTPKSNTYNDLATEHLYINSFKRCFNTTEALNYLGIKRRAFESHLLPLLEGKGIRMGTSVIFERSDLDRAWDLYKIQVGKERSGENGGYSKWIVPKYRESMSQTPPMKLTGDMQANVFDSVASQVLKKRKAG